MTDKEEEAWQLGYRAAHLSIFSGAMKALGYDDPVSNGARWIAEREAVVRALRAACKVCGLSMDRDANAALNLEHLSSAGSARFQARRDFWLQGSMKREPSSLVSYWA